MLLNDVQFVEAARSLAAVALHQAGDDLSRIGEVYQRLAGRMPNAPESAVLLRCLQEQRNTFRSDRESAVKFVATGESPVPASLDPVELAAMTVTVQAVSNSDAVVWKR